jgi:hypothetical protein
MNLFVQFRATPLHIPTLLTAMLMYSMPTLAAPVFYDYAAPAIEKSLFSATGFIEIDDANTLGEVPGESLNVALLSWGFTWFEGVELGIQTRFSVHAEGH